MKSKPKLSMKKISTNSATNLTNNVNSNSISKENKKRVIIILDEFTQLIDRTKFDPILEIFKSNEMLKEFYIKRIFELIKVI
jgi:Cdc6-like AAA superfamily ATPase